jgi:peroxiredoxin
MKAYRDKYATIRSKGAEVLAVSTDDVETLRRFKASLEAPFPFLSDPEGKVARLYAGFSHGTANRVTITIDADGTIAHVTQGLGAILPESDIKACPVHKGAPPAEPDST